jgi:hypothetical protein
LLSWIDDGSGGCETCGRKEEIVFKPSDFEVPPHGSWVCASCDPEEHEDFARGLVEFGHEIGHKPS